MLSAEYIEEPGNRQVSKKQFPAGAGIFHGVFGFRNDVDFSKKWRFPGSLLVHCDRIEAQACYRKFATNVVNTPAQKYPSHVHF